MANYRDTMDQIRGQIANLADILEETVDGSCKTNFMAAIKQRTIQTDECNISTSKSNSKADNGNRNASTKAASKKQSVAAAKNQ